MKPGGDSLLRSQNYRAGILHRQLCRRETGNTRYGRSRCPVPASQEHEQGYMTMAYEIMGAPPPPPPHLPPSLSSTHHVLIWQNATSVFCGQVETDNGVQHRSAERHYCMSIKAGTACSALQLYTTTRPRLLGSRQYSAVLFGASRTNVLTLLSLDALGFNGLFFGVLCRRALWRGNVAIMSTSAGIRKTAWRRNLVELSSCERSGWQGDESSSSGKIHVTKSATVRDWALHCHMAKVPPSIVRCGEISCAEVRFSELQGTRAVPETRERSMTESPWGHT